MSCQGNRLSTIKLLVFIHTAQCALNTTDLETHDSHNGLLSVQCTAEQHWTEYNITRVSSLRCPMSGVRSECEKTSNGHNNASSNRLMFGSRFVFLARTD